MDTMKELLASKKVRVALAAILVWVGARFGLQLDAGDVEPIVYILITLIGAQGIADAGKERAKVETAAAKEGVGTARVEVTIPPPIAPLAAPNAFPEALGRQRRQNTPTPGTRDLSGAITRTLREEALADREARRKAELARLDAATAAAAAKKKEEEGLP